MDQEDPIQRLLQSTGWSCDDLLQKLQNYKNPKPTLEPKQTEKTETTEDTSTNTKQDTQLLTISNNSTAVNFPNLIVSSNLNESIVNTPTTRSNLNESFSDTDDEEEEVNATNSSIINEIIDDIKETDEVKDTDCLNVECELQDNKPSEVTEVRVIEVNEEEVDKDEEQENILKPEEIERLEKYHSSDDSETITIETEPDKKKIDYIEIHPSQKFKVVRKYASKPTQQGKFSKFKVSSIEKVENVPDEKPKIVYRPRVIIKKKVQIAEDDNKEINSYNSQKMANVTTFVKPPIKSGSFSQTMASITRIVSNPPTITKVISLKGNNTIDLKEPTIIPKRHYTNNKKFGFLHLKNPAALCTPTKESSLFRLGCGGGIIKDNTIENIVPQNRVEENLMGRSILKPRPMEITGEDEKVEEESNIMENLRNNLKLQLSSLRTKKKSQFLETTSTNVIDNIQCSKKLFLLESKKNEALINTGEQIYNQTNEFGLVISDVQGGVEMEEGLDSKIDNEVDEEDSGKGNESEERVFDEIRKIINKQKLPPKLSISKTNDNSLCMQKRLPKTDEDKKMDISCENSQTSFTEVEEKSPFVSDTLDEFLTADSKLNISYQVPKLGAEEGLKNFTEESHLILKRVEHIKDNDESRDNLGVFKRKPTPTVKAKTVAQKRRLLEKERRKELRKQKKKKLKELKERVKVVAKEIEEMKMKKNIEIKSKVVQKHRPNRSYVLCNDDKIWIKSNVPNKCFARIDCLKKTSTAPKVVQKRKLSLLHQTFKKQCPVKYAPGPLSKKFNLQLSGKDKWETKMVKLPKIFLEVSPQLGKPLSNAILHRFSNIIGGELDSDKIEFALSAVKFNTGIKEEKLDPLQFPLEYHNRVEHVLTRRPKKVIQEEKICNDSINSTDAVSDVIEGLIRYVEIKELAPTLIKEDDSKLPTEDYLGSNNSSPTKDNVSVFKKPHKRRSKVESELLRLSCKVVNVQVEETEDDPLCSKPHCQLGCLCKSLKCEYILTRHCQKPSCMFNCTCPEEKPRIYDKLTLPAGTNLLSEDTVNRIEDEAKKHLAKVEKEFTQTVIHTNDKTIVVGIGDRTKTRRAAKIPAKFSDFVSSSNILHDNEESYRKMCVVSLPKLNLTEIIPYCLTHNMYNCFCKGLEVDSPISICSTPEVQSNKRKSLVDMKSKKKKKLKQVKPVKAETDPLAVKSRSESETSLDELWKPKEYLNLNINESSKRPVRSIKRKVFNNDYLDDYTEDDTLRCARAIQISKKYKRSLRYTPNIYQDDFINTLSESDLFRARLQYNTPDMVLSEADLLKQTILSEKIQLDQSRNKTKRKQTLESRKEYTSPPNLNSNLAIQRRKKLKQTLLSAKTRPVFEGEIIIDKSNMDLLKKMGPRTVADGYARLLPWNSLITSFYKRTIRIWSMIDQPSRLLINTHDKKCPKNYIDILKLRTSTEVINWIKKKKLPSCYQADSLSFILKETKNNFEICGICTKNIVQKVDQQKSDSDEDAEDVITEKAEIFYHKDLSGVERFFKLHKENYETLVLAEDLPDYYQVKIRDLRVGLPSISDDCKWRMLFLNSDFTFLFFRSIPYSIRYTDLLAIEHYAKTKNSTVRIENKAMAKSYKHDLFGIYFEPNFSDRIFIGPYYDDCDSNDVETLRYINQSLVSTKSFNMMRGKGDYKCGHWLKEFVPNSKYFMDSPTDDTTDNTIDLTSDNELESSKTVCEITKHPSDTQEYYPFSSKIIHNKQEIKIIDAPPRKPEDFNRYIITNIPHFGYLGAYMHKHGEIDVSWPFENKLLRFCSETAATSFLQDRFSSLLQSVPETFRINIIVALTVDLTVYCPIDSKVLNGHYICGDFGYMNILDTSEEDCQTKVGVPKDEILKLFSKRAQNFVRKKLETLSYLLQIPKNKTRCFDLPLILRKAAEEIQQQIEKERGYKIMKNTLFLRKRENAIKLHKLLSQLPADQRNAENIKFRAILHKTGQLPIVINDSDEEANKLEGSKSGLGSTPNTSTISLKSILKPLVTVPLGKDNILLRMDLKCLEEKDPLALSTSPVDQPKYIPGVKLVKNSEGGFMLINKAASPDKTEIVIKNNKIINETTDDVNQQSCSNQSEDKTEKNKSEVIDLDDDVIPIENEPMIIDLDDFPSDDE